MFKITLIASKSRSVALWSILCDFWRSKSVRIWFKFDSMFDIDNYFARITSIRDNKFHHCLEFNSKCNILKISVNNLVWFNLFEITIYQWSLGHSQRNSFITLLNFTEQDLNCIFKALINFKTTIYEIVLRSLREMKMFFFNSFSFN